MFFLTLTLDFQILTALRAMGMTHIRTKIKVMLVQNNKSVLTGLLNVTERQTDKETKL